MEWLLTYADCDPAGIIYYASAFPIMERAFMAWALDNGVAPDQLRALGEPLPVARSASADYFIPMKVLDRIRCDLYCDSIGRSSIDWRTTFTPLASLEGPSPADAPIVFEGHLRQVYVGGDGRSTSVPDVVRKLIEEFLS
jgi:acyl-CoA thioesterase FadM